MSRGLYVETLIRAPLERVWETTQDPVRHERWDLRFTEITYGEPPAAGQPRSFVYAIRIGPRGRPLVRVAGTGTTIGERARPDGTRTSALRFGSPDPRSPILDGSGWWRYVPTPEGVRFLTGYTYRTRWGRVGAAADRWALRPLMGWGTAWSFDRLRLWLEDGVPPESALRRALLDGGLRVAAVAGPPLLVPRRPVAVRLLAGLAGLAAVVLTPTLPGVPRAGRCRRAPSDDLGRRAPSVTERLSAREAR